MIAIGATKQIVAMIKIIHWSRCIQYLDLDWIESQNHMENVSNLDKDTQEDKRRNL